MTAADVFQPGSTALITGAASGIGLAIAKLCHSKGMKVILVDVNKKSLQEAQSSISGDVEAHVLDVSVLQDWKTLKDKVAANSSVELLVLNAGRGIRGGFGDDQYFRDTLETNLFGVINGINTFLPVIKEASASKPSAIVITGSKQGITNPPGNPAYNASKAAVKSLTEQLSFDLRKSKISVHLLVPGWTFTGMSGSGKNPKPDGAWEPSQVADFLYKKMGENQFYVICPDNDVTEATDRKRMLWSIGDVIKGRLPLSRWREEWKKEAQETIDKTNLD